MRFFRKDKKDPEFKETSDLHNLTLESEMNKQFQAYRERFFQEPFVQGNLHNSFNRNWIDMTKCEVYGIHKCNLNDFEDNFAVYLASKWENENDRPIIFLGTLKECEDYLQKIIDYKKGLK